MELEIKKLKNIPLLSDLQTRFKNILVLDFETIPNGDTYHIGALFNDKTFQKKNIKNLKTALGELSEFSNGADYLLGHNIFNHDLRIANDASPEAEFLKLPVIDTLFLSPLAFPENPYHKLVKDYKLAKKSKNDPVADSIIALTLFEDQLIAFLTILEKKPDLISFFAFSFKIFSFNSKSPDLKGIHDLFHFLSRGTPAEEEAQNIFRSLCQGKICNNGLKQIWDRSLKNTFQRPVLAYLLSWLMVSGGNSIIPPWVRLQFPEISGFVKKLRYACEDTSCKYCRKNNDSEKLLKKHFGFKKYRRLPDGRLLQKEIIDSALRGKPLLGILPTGGGKSICYQIPALHRYDRLGELTIVISPLKALMKDQIDNLNRTTGTESAAAINGSLTLPERGSVMEKVRLGDIGILYISPEQLRNFSIAQLIKSRVTGFWVFDEAHCLSKWGHDFRPDYLYVSEFIRKYCNDTESQPIIGAFTATAKKDVIEEISSHFKEKLSIDIEPFIGDIQRENLNFEVWPVRKNEKYGLILNCLNDTFAKHESGAIVYCSTRRGTEEISLFLNEQGISSEAFHAGRSEPDKRNIQDDFVDGKIPVICATNAFGMGIDKKDIRLVIHADIPGSLENYLQEAGRAGRDMAPSDCILLYEEEDIQNQFSLNSYSLISIKDIKKILKILKKRDAKTPEIIITPGEIMRLIGHGGVDGNDTRARIGISWLERKGFVERSFNQTFFFKGIPAVKSMEEAEKKIEKLNLSITMQAVFTTIMNFLFNAEVNTTLSADDMCAALGNIKNLPAKYLDSREIITLLYEMAEIGLIREGIVLTAFVRPGGRNSSPKLLDYFSAVENRMLHIMEDMAPDSGLSADSADIFNLRLMSQRLKDNGFENINSDIVEKILRSMANDKGEKEGKSIKVTGKKGADQRWIYIKFPWEEIKQRVELRHHAAMVILREITSSLPASLKKGQAEVLSEFFISDIINAMGRDIFLSVIKGDFKSLIERSLLYMHDVKIITLQNGLGIFRQAMRIKILQESKKRQYTKGDYEPLSHHFAQKNVQVHVMDKYAGLGMEKIKTALNFVCDYFSTSYDSFIAQYFPGQKELIKTAMTAEAYKNIVQSLENSLQESIVATPPEKNILVLAGPGSGKTKTIVHRCAWLIKAKSVDPSSILVLCFNHQAMLELKKRIKRLTGKSGDSVTSMTYHGFAMRLAGISLLDKYHEFRAFNSLQNFNSIIDEAVDILNGKKAIPGIEKSEARDYFLAGYRHILVDEYQDIDERQYRFISALTGRLEEDNEAKISIMAVGDDDQSIYGFRDANITFIKKFKEDYNAKTFYLVENYRSSYPIIEASGEFISLNNNRMKKSQTCRINSKRKSRKKTPEKIKKEALVQIIYVKNIESQAAWVANEIKEMLHENQEITMDDFAVISRQGISYPYLVSVRMALAKKNIDFCYSIKGGAGFPMFRIREIQEFLEYLDGNKTRRIRPVCLKEEVLEKFNQNNIWTDQIEQILESWCQINSDIEISTLEAKNFTLKTLLEERREQKIGKGVFLGTVHGVKGMEFPYVFILDGGWKGRAIEEERRLFYVGMTRGKKILYLCRLETGNNPHVPVLMESSFIHRKRAEPSKIDGYTDDLTVSILGMEDLFISYPALFPENHEIDKNLANLKTGNKVHLMEKEERIYITNDKNRIIGSLSKKASLKWKGNTHKILNGKILGIIKRKQQDNEADEHKNIKKKSWELPMVEILHRRLKMEV